MPEAAGKEQALFLIPSNNGEEPSKSREKGRSGYGVRDLIHLDWKLKARHTEPKGLQLANSHIVYSSPDNKQKSKSA